MPYSWESTGLQMTPIEAWLWGDIRCVGSVLYPQYPVGGFFVDFGNPVAKVAVECDGHDFHLDKAKDDRRDAALRALGWTVYRFTGSECKEDTSEHYDDNGNLVIKASETYRRIADLTLRHGILVGTNRGRT